LHTGGLLLGATKTKSKSCSSAFSIASLILSTPSFSPVESITCTSFSLI
jgi:hypothetical protein